MVDVILGLQWGDEGKGKIVDYFANNYDVIARFQGGPNAGHTLYVEGKKVVLHQIPSGIFHEDKVKLIGNGVVLDAITLKKECENVAAMGIDYKKNFFGKPVVYVENGKTSTGLNPILFAKQMEEAGAGEILLNSIERDGGFEGYDLEMIEKVAHAVNIPMIAIGGAASLSDFKRAVQYGASAVSAGSFFVFQRPHRAVLISYPSQQDLEKYVYDWL